MNKERNCQKCIHHISGLCSKWDCEMTTLENYRDKVINEFATTLIPRLTDAIYQKDVESMTNLINDVVRELKAGGIDG